MPVSSEDHIDEAIDALKHGSAAALKDTGKAADEQIDEGFDEGKDAMGRPWTPLAQSTSDEKGHDDILIDTGPMRGDSGWEYNAGSNEVRIGGNDKKLPLHEFGTEHIPKRPVLGPAAEYLANDVLEEIFTDELSRRLAAVGIY